MQLLNWQLFSIGGVLTSLFLTYYVRNQAIINSVIDIPNERSSHTNPTPRGGGLAIVIPTLIGSIYLYVASFDKGLLVYIVGGLVIATVSWIDDVRSLSNKVRFLTHALVAAISLLWIGSWQFIEFPFWGSRNISWIGFIVTFLWIVGLTNIYNFMDGIDGLAGGQAIVAGIGWAIIGRLTNHPEGLLLGTLIAASSAGFLYFNWSPARIFMGDVGSAFLGYSFAILPLLHHGAAGETEFKGKSLWIGILMIWPFIIDSTYTLLRRLFRGENIFQAHRSHIYQQLVIAGYRHSTVSIVYLGLGVIGIVVAVQYIKS